MISESNDKLRPSLLTLVWALSPTLVLFGVWFQIMCFIFVNAMEIPDNTHGIHLSFTQAIKNLLVILFKF